MKKRIVAFVEYIKQRKRYIRYIRYFKKLMCMQHIENKSAEGEQEYIRFWKRLCPYVEPYSYRFFSHYCGKTPYIVPEDIGHSFIETKLNPNRYTPFYSDKNMLPILLPKSYLPRTILARIQGGSVLMGDYVPSTITDHTSAEDVCAIINEKVNLIIKPSIDSSSGRRVMLFTMQNNKFVSQDGKCVLDGQYLFRYGNDWVVQEAITQHPLLSHLCSSSVNTIRVIAYRSVVDEQVYIPAAAIRIGHEGSIVDNLHQGGGMVGIDINTGELKHEILDQYGNRTYVLNNIDYSKETFVIPNWDSVKAFAKDVASGNKHCRLLALDITIKENGSPVLLEWNVSPYSFSYWIPMMTGVTPFGDKTEEIVQYCMSK